MLEDQIKSTNEDTIKRNIDIVQKYIRIIHLLVIISKIIIIIKIINPCFYTLILHPLLPSVV